MADTAWSQYRELQDERFYSFSLIYLLKLFVFVFFYSESPEGSLKLPSDFAFYFCLKNNYVFRQNLQLMARAKHLLSSVLERQD